ncbi:MAG: methyltransferase domain-containing protein [Parachlamydiaceae bacterium]|nr:methyltransferase domain-containing protein [Parachlamydiaceae bacterium]
MIKRKRSYETELLDLGPSFYTNEEYEECLNQLDRIGRYLGGNKATLKTLHNLPKPHSILDVGCGGGHFTIELAKQFPDAQVVGIDISQEAITFARKKLQHANVGNVLFEVPPSNQLSYSPNSFDIVTSSLVCHHMDDDQLINFLKNSYQVAAKTIIINDLHRHWLAYLSFALIAKPVFCNRLIFHDGLLSIKRAFKKQDWIHYLKAAEIPLEYCTITWHWAFRWVLRIDTSHKFKQ